MGPRRTTSIRRAGVGAAAAAALLLAGCGDDATDEPADDATADDGGTEQTEQATSGPGFVAIVQDDEGSEIGEVEFTDIDGVLVVDVQVEGLDPGFYGLHVHGVGECEPDSSPPDDPSRTGAFLSAGSHISTGDADHPDHEGDLPILLVQESGEGRMTVHTDRLTPELLEDGDGAALIIHADPDNYANIPERYAAEGPDEDTLGTGDAGGRAACGVINAVG